MALLIPIEYSTKIKQILIDKNVYQSKFRPRKIGHRLALPIDGKFDTLSEEIYSIIPNLVGEITFEENVLEINTPNLTPGQLMSKKIFGWLEGLSYDFNMDLLIDRIPLKWELLGDLALLPSNSFTQKEWVKLFSECQDSELVELWQVICNSLNVNRLGRQQPISNDMMRTSQVELLLGQEGWVELLDHGVHFGFDATKVMYSSGNVTERHRIGNIDMNGEVVIDAFAGIGYYSLPMLVRSNVKHLHACEVNPKSIEALIWGAKKNNVSQKLTIHEGDNKITLKNLKNIADRCHLGILPSSEGVWYLALQCLKSEGGWLHIHMNVAEEKIPAWIEQTISELGIISQNIGREWKIEAKHLEKVKWYAPHIRHIVLDVYCSY
jgi:tRNA wybutosine-synthesizing protein 3